MSGIHFPPNMQLGGINYVVHFVVLFSVCLQAPSPYSNNGRKELKYSKQIKHCSLRKKTFTMSPKFTVKLSQSLILTLVICPWLCIHMKSHPKKSGFLGHPVTRAIKSDKYEGNSEKYKGNSKNYKGKSISILFWS